MGIHGEPGVWRGKLKPVDAIVDELVDRLTTDMPLEQGDRISILVNGAGATPIEELYLVFRRANALLAEKGVTLVCPMVGNYATSMEMVCEYANLRVTLKGTLKKYPGCIHWHLKREGERGTLEMTWSPRDASSSVAFSAPQSYGRLDRRPQA
jgi:dihydroxyacetone kinase-like protein